jgi:transcriptional regulator with XRE-family HTH domain
MNALRYIVDGGSGATLEPAGERILTYLMDNPGIRHRDEIAEACGLIVGSRTVDTNIAQIRKALGYDLDRIVSASGKRGYLWSGDRVTLVPVTWTQASPRNEDPLARYAVMTQADVAKRLGITAAAVGAIERKALAKLKKRPALMKEWAEMLAHEARHHYDPFHECWLFQVAEEVANPYVEEPTSAE